MTETLPETVPTIREAVSRQLFGAANVQWERVRQGVSTRVYRIDQRGELYYLRILPEPGATFAPEVRAHRLARDLECRVPEVLYYEPCNELLGRSVMLTSQIPGRPLSTGDDPAVIRDGVRLAGIDLAKINSIAIHGFGWVRRDSEQVPKQLTAEHPTLASLLEAEYVRAVEGLPGDAVPGFPQLTLNDAAHRAMRLIGDVEESWLAHGDFDTSHIFIKDGRYSGIIDFGEMRGMPWFYDLAHHHMHDRERLPFSTLGWLMEGYRDVSALPCDIERRLSAMSLLIATRALYRGLRFRPDSQIVTTARRAIRRELLLAEERG